jgi:magnesium transporter
MILDSAIYVDGRRERDLVPLSGTYEATRKLHGLAWVDLYDPTPEELEAVVEEFEPHCAALEDATSPHQRPRVEGYGGNVKLVILKTACYVDEKERVDLGELRVLVGPDFVVTITVPLRRSPAATGDSISLEVRRRLESDPRLLRRGAPEVLHQTFERVVESYDPVVEGLENDVDEIENDVFEGRSGVSRRIYELFREVVEFQRATKPLVAVLDRLLEEGSEPETRRRVRELRSRVLRVTEQVADLRDLLTNILDVNLTQISISQNDQTKKISAWAAILIVPTLIAGIYGMNFDYMPELQWRYGYPYALSLMGLVALALYLGFRRSGWL